MSTLDINPLITSQFHNCIPHIHPTHRHTLSLMYPRTQERHMSKPEISGNLVTGHYEHHPYSTIPGKHQHTGQPRWHSSQATHKLKNFLSLSVCRQLPSYTQDLESPCRKATIHSALRTNLAHVSAGKSAAPESVEAPFYVHQWGVWKSLLGANSPLMSKPEFKIKPLTAARTHSPFSRLTHASSLWSPHSENLFHLRGKRRRTKER